LLLSSKQQFLHFAVGILRRHKTLVEAVSEYLSIYPDDVCATYYLADKKVELKEYDEAEKLANDILAKYEDFYFAHLLLAEIYCEKGRL